MRFFAKWAKIKGGNEELKHSIEGKSIVCNKKSLPYYNHVEMAGFYCSAITSYGANRRGYLKMLRHVTFPMLRTIPNNTHGSLNHNFKGVSIIADGKRIKECAENFIFDGTLTIKSFYRDLNIERVLIPSTDNAYLIERITIDNKSKKTCYLHLKDNDKKSFTLPIRGVNGNVYEIGCNIGDYSNILEKNKKATIFVCYYACNKGAELEFDPIGGFKSRFDFIESLDKKLVINTPDKNVNMMARFAKIRASESIFKTKAGLMHSPGGGGYYAAVWTNDQCEYVNPLFAYLGYDVGKQQSKNCYMLYTKYIGENKPLVSSIVAEGDSFWNGAGDRGDAAMYAYGASRYMLSAKDKDLDLLENIRKCLKFTISQINSDGVVASDSDELENRFASGKANLSTSCLTYDALISSAYIEEEIGDKSKAEYYLKTANELKSSIEKYFGSTVEGFNTYRYCAEETKLRSWISLPLVVGIFDRTDATIDALFKSELKMREGLTSRSGSKTFWDRSTLYSLRGIFYANRADSAYDLFTTYTASRLLGEHIPYAVEAYPEGNQAQLSAESGLYLRIITEGILGYRPCGFNKFELKPNLPAKWAFTEVKNIDFGGVSLDIRVERTKDGYTVKLSNGNTSKIAFGEKVILKI